MASDVLGEAELALNEALSRLRKFHVAGGSTHHHEIVSSYLVRGLRWLDTIGVLLSRGRGEAAVVAARSLYELAMTFYVDWLAPEFAGDAFKLAAQSTGVDLKTLLQEVEASWIAEGWGPNAARAMSSGIKAKLKLLTTISTRSRLTPFRDIHPDLYRALCQVSHQDATTAAAFSGYLSPTTDPLAIDDAALNDDASLACTTARLATQLLVDCAKRDLDASTYGPPAT